MSTVSRRCAASPSRKCTACNKETQRQDQRDAIGDYGAWTLSNYFGITGYFCRQCYSKVSHDAYGNPNYPNEYLLMLLKLGAKNDNR